MQVLPLREWREALSFLPFLRLYVLNHPYEVYVCRSSVCAFPCFCPAPHTAHLEHGGLFLFVHIPTTVLLCLTSAPQKPPRIS